MSTLNKNSDNFAKYFEGLVKELYHEVELLREWFKRDYPEADLRVFCDVNNITSSFIIKTEILMGQEVASNRGFFSNKIILSEKDIRDPSLMRSFFKHFGTKYREEIARAYNAHYGANKDVDL